MIETFFKVSTDILYVKLEISPTSYLRNKLNGHMDKRRERFLQAWVLDGSVWLAFRADGDRDGKLKSLVYNTLKLKKTNEERFSSLAALSADASQAMAEDLFAEDVAETALAVSPRPAAPKSHCAPAEWTR